MTTSTKNNLHLFYGLLYVALLAIISYLIVNIPGVAKTGISSLVVAIILGILFGNIWHSPSSWTPGIQFAAKRLLRLAIILYGFRISFQQIASLGVSALLLDTFVVSFTLLIGFWVGSKLLKLDRDIALLISAGAAICGAAAVLAVEDILKSEPYKAAVAVGTVVLFGTLSMFLYPLLQHANILGLTHHQFGIMAGASIHEVAQALVAGTHIDVETGQIAVVVKMMRVLLLVPVLFLFAILKKQSAKHHPNQKTTFIIPWFALGFVIVIGFNSLQLLPSHSIDLINQVDTILLTMAMGAIGIETKLSKMKPVGMKPLYLAAVLFLWLFSSVFIMVKLN